jgi:hypothetical protein
MNTTTMKQLNKVKNTEFVVISFSATGEQKRTMMQGGVGIVRAVEEVKSHQLRGEISMILDMDMWSKVGDFEHKLEGFERINLSQVMDMIKPQ